MILTSVNKKWVCEIQKRNYVLETTYVHISLKEILDKFRRYFMINFEIFFVECIV